MTIIAYFTLFSVLSTTFILGLLLSKGLKTAFEQKVFIFNLALLAWQVEDFLLRIPVSKDVISEVDMYLSFSYIFIGYFLLNVIAEARLIEIRILYWIRVLVFLVSMFLFVSYITFPEPRIFIESTTFGLVLGFREGSLDIVLRAWVGICILLSLFVLARALVNNSVNFKSLKLFFIGLSLPSFYGLVFQVVFPVVYGYEIPGTTILLCIFSIMSLYVFKHNFVYFNFSDEYIPSVFDKISAIVFIFDSRGVVNYGNKVYNKYFSDHDSIYGFKEGVNFLTAMSPLMERGNSSLTDEKKIKIFNSDERIGNRYFQYTCCPILHEGEVKGGIVFGLNVTKFAQMKNEIVSSFENFKRLNRVPNSYFLEIDLVEGKILLNDRFIQKFLVFKKDYFSYHELFLFLRRYADIDSMRRLVEDLKAQDVTVYRSTGNKTLLKLNSEEIFYVFEISLKKFDHQVTSKNHMIYITDITDTYLDTLNNEWVSKSIPWVVSHVFRKPVANILGLLNLIRNEKEVFDSRLSLIDVYSLINEEVKDLDSKIEVFAQENTTR